MDLLWILIVALIVLWFGGFFLKVGGKIIHILLILAAIALVLRLLGII